MWAGGVFEPLFLLRTVTLIQLGYFFAVLITYNVHCVINNNYRNFMRNVLKTKKVIILLVCMVLIYASPFALMYYNTSDPDSSDYAYSYGPTGFVYNNHHLLLFCGQCSNPLKPYWEKILLFQVPLIPIIGLPDPHHTAGDPLHLRLLSAEADPAVPG